MTLATIQDQIALLEEKKQRLEQEDKIDENELNLVINRLSELKLELEQQQELEQTKQERVQTAITETAAAVDNMEIAPGMQLRDMCIDEQSYQFVKIAFQTLLNNKDSAYIEELTSIQAKHQEESRAANERETNLTFQLKAKDQTIDQFIDENDELKKQVSTLTFERDEALKVRDNAAAEIEGYKLAVDEKQHQIDTLRAEIAIGAKGAQQVDQTEQLRKAQEEWLASRIKVTNIRWADDLTKRDYNAELVSTGETIIFNRLEKGKYLEVSADDAARFRAEQAQAKEQAPVPDIPLVQPPEVQQVVPAVETDFRTDSDTSTETAVPAGPDQSADTALAGQTLEERVTALEKVVFGSAKVA